MSGWGLRMGDTVTHRLVGSEPQMMLCSVITPFAGGHHQDQHPPGQCHPQKSPQSFRLFLMMTSVTASKTNCTFLVSVAQVKWV